MLPGNGNTLPRQSSLRLSVKAPGRENTSTPTDFPRSSNVARSWLFAATPPETSTLATAALPPRAWCALPNRAPPHSETRVPSASVFGRAQRQQLFELSSRRLQCFFRARNLFLRIPDALAHD